MPAAIRQRPQPTWLHPKWCVAPLDCRSGNATGWPNSQPPHTHIPNEASACYPRRAHHTASIAVEGAAGARGSLQQCHLSSRCSTKCGKGSGSPHHQSILRTSEYSAPPRSPHHQTKLRTNRDSSSSAQGYSAPADTALQPRQRQLTLAAAAQRRDHQGVPECPLVGDGRRKRTAGRSTSRPSFRTERRKAGGELQVP